jgi:hypothetical protein
VFDAALLAGGGALPAGVHAANVSAMSAAAQTRRA